MRFGSDEVTYWIKMSILDAENTEWQGKLLDVIRQDVAAILYSKVPNAQDREEIISDVQYEAIQYLSYFYRQESGYEARQRNGWLKTVAKNKSVDLYRHQQRTIQVSTSLDDVWNLSDESDEYARRQTDAQIKLYEVFRILGEINTTPDKCLAFLLNRLLAAQYESTGRPAKIAEKMEGLSLRDVFEQVKVQLEIQLNGKVPDGILEPIWRKVEPVADQPFHLTTRRITDISNWLSAKSRDEYRRRSNL